MAKDWSGMTGSRAGMMVALGWLLLCAGCGGLPGARAQAPTIIPATRLAERTLTLADIPTGFRLALDLQPGETDLLRHLGTPQDAAVLAGAGRTGGTWRLFTYSQPEPTALNGTTRVTVEVDIFQSTVGAEQWFTARQAHITLLPGFPADAPAPGQRHAIQLTTYRASTAAATTIVLAFIDVNAYVEIATIFVGPGPSLADAARYADLIDARLHHLPAA